MYCPNCNKEFDGKFCPECGTKLIEKPATSAGVVNLGDANAISGGLHVNDSHNVHNEDRSVHNINNVTHNIIKERSKSEREVELDALNILRSKAEDLMRERGRIDSVAMEVLRPLSKQLGVVDSTFREMIREVRSNRNVGSINGANARYLQQAIAAVEENNMDVLSDITPRLEAMASISQDDNVQYLYHLTLALLYPLKSIDIYENQTDENYWRSFWAIISYIRTAKYKQAMSLLVMLDPARYEKPEDDGNLLEAYFNIIKGDRDEAQNFLDEIIGEPSAQLKPLLRAVETVLYDEEPDATAVKFYVERIMTKVGTNSFAEDNSTESSIERQNAPDAQDSIANANTSKSEELYNQSHQATGMKRIMLLTEAANNGSSDAMFTLGECYMDGKDAEKDEDQALRWYQKAADNGHAAGLTIMGVAYLNGLWGKEKNLDKGEELLLAAAAKDLRESQGILAQLYIEKEDYSKAIVYANQAALYDDEAGLDALGTIYLNGLGVDINGSEALKCYEKLALKGNADAQNLVGNLFYNDDLGIPKDVEKAFRFHQMAALQEHVYGMFNIGVALINGDGCDANVVEGCKWIEKAAEKECPEAKEWLLNYQGYQPPYGESEYQEAEHARVEITNVSTDGKKKLVVHYDLELSGFNLLYSDEYCESLMVNLIGCHTSNIPMGCGDCLLGDDINGKNITLHRSISVDIVKELSLKHKQTRSIQIKLSCEKCDIEETFPTMSESNVVEVTLYHENPFFGSCSLKIL